MNKATASWAKDTLFLALCWFNALWMPLNLPRGQDEGRLAVIVYGVIILFLVVSENRAIEKGKRRADVSKLALWPLYIGYLVCLFLVLR
jgi:hypothetical protein